MFFLFQQGDKSEVWWGEQREEMRKSCEEEEEEEEINPNTLELLVYWEQEDGC